MNDSIFLSQLPLVEIKENPSEPNKFQLCQKEPPLNVTLTAHKEQTKTNWLTEIRKHASDAGKTHLKVSDNPV